MTMISSSLYRIWVHSFFFIRTSNFDAEAERSYIFWRFEAETFLKMFLNLPDDFDGVEVILEQLWIGTTDTRFLKKTWWRWNFFGTL